jgi:hypothetical protein
LNLFLHLQSHNLLRWIHPATINSIYCVRKMRIQQRENEGMCCQGLEYTLHAVVLHWLQQAVRLSQRPERRCRKHTQMHARAHASASSLPGCFQQHPLMPARICPLVLVVPPVEQPLVPLSLPLELLLVIDSVVPPPPSAVKLVLAASSSSPVSAAPG